MKPLNAGPINLLFDAETGSIRQIRHGDHELIRQIYGAIRSQSWATARPILSHVSIHDEDPAQFKITFVADCQKDDIHYVWNGSIEGNADHLQFTFDGEAQSDFLSNRIGLCLLHPMSCSGKPCEVEHANGQTESSAFPELISPHQPFKQIRAIRHHAPNGLKIDVRFDGEIFEMEDQRNWTDASFKTYAPPLDRPLPVTVKRGHKVRNSITLTWTINDSRPAIARGISYGPEVTQIKVHWDRLRPKPPVGFGCPNPIIPDLWASQKLRALRPSHLRVDCHLSQLDSIARLAEADIHARALNAGLHIALLLGNNDDVELKLFRTACRELTSPVQLWLIFHESEKTTPPATVSRVEKMLREIAPHAPLAAGTDGYFVEINRKRPSPDADFLPFYSINPQVHSIDSMTVMQNMAAQIETIKTARSFSKHPIVVSPITLLPRPAIDPRQRSQLAAAWTLGSLATLATTDSVHSLTYFETTGDRGLMDVEKSELFPVYQIFASWSEMVQIAPAELINDPAMRVAALAGIYRHGARVIWLANLTSEKVSVLMEKADSEKLLLAPYEVVKKTLKI